MKAGWWTGFWLLCAGCAAQTDGLVELEDSVSTLEKHQRELQARVEQLEKRDAAAMRNTKTGAETHVKIDALADQIRNLTGRMDEQKNSASALAKKSDDQAFRMQQMRERLTALEGEERPVTRTPIPPPAPPPRSGLPDFNAPPPNAELPAPPVLPALPAPGTPDEADEKVVLPGRIVGQKVPDTSPTDAFNLAYGDYLKGNDDLAISGFSNFLQQYPASALVPQAIYWLGESHYSKRAYPKAIEYFERLHQKYPKSEKVATALLKEGFSYAELGDRFKAKIYLKRVIEVFPQSNEASLAKDKLAALE